MRNRAGMLATVVFGMLGLATPASADITSYAFVNDDGSLRVSGHTIYLYGIYIPPTDETCRTFEIPIKCGPRAVLALDFTIGPNFVHCKPMRTNEDGSIEALCRVNDIDLSEWMLQNGWAVSLPDAPFEYKTMEEIARQRGIGIWGIPLDVIPKKRHRRAFPGR